MRYPLYQADWPTAFNKVTKYLGRHWPTGKLTLNDAREKTARLLGYSSLHDVKKELLDDRDPTHAKGFDHYSMHTLMTLKAWVLYRAPMDKMEKLVNRLPWGELRAQAHYLESLSKIQPFYMDEYGYYGNVKTNGHLVDLLNNKVIPPYAYALKSNDDFYCPDHVESILNFCDSLESMQELGFEGDMKGFITQHIEPLFWRPLDEALEKVGFNSIYELSGATMCFVEPLFGEKNAYMIRYLGWGSSVFLPIVARTEVQLREALGKFLRRESFYELESPIDSQAFYSQMSREGSGDSGKELPPKGQWFMDNGQYFYSPRGEERDLWVVLGESLPNIKPYMDSSTQEDPVLFVSGESIRCYKAVKAYLRDHADLDARYLSMSTVERVSLLKKVFGDKIITGADLSAKGLLIHEDQPHNVSECMGNPNIVREDVSTLHEMGENVLKFHPELSEYFDPEALGYFHRASDAYDQPVFLIEPDVFLVGYLMMRSLDAHEGIRVQRKASEIPLLGTLCLQWVLQDGGKSDEDLPSWYEWSELMVRYNESQWLYTNLLSQREDLEVINTDPAFVSNGRTKSITHQTMAEMLSDLTKRHSTLN